MKAVGITNTYTEAQLSGAGADAVIASLADFNPAWLNQRF
jgi:phosphoglycolate phosphatase-like HAD superfamily hydrolase